MSEFDEWLSTRPEEIKQLAHLYPPGTIILVDGKQQYIVGYAETDKEPGLYVSEINPCDDYDAALESKSFICGEHIKPLS